MLSHAGIDTYYKGSKTFSCNKAVFGSLVKKKMQVVINRSKNGGRLHGTGSFELLWIYGKQEGAPVQCLIHRSCPENNFAKVANRYFQRQKRRSDQLCLDILPDLKLCVSYK